MVTAAGVARMAGVGRAAVSNWRRRYGDFPRPVDGRDSSPSFRLAEIEAWLREQGKLGPQSLIELAWQAVATAGDGAPSEVVARIGEHLRGVDVDLPSGIRSAVADVAAEIGAMEAFEQLCARYVEASSRQLAVTPHDLASLMIELARVDTGSVLDPACGTGSLLCASPSGVTVLGQELDPGLARLVRARLAFTHDVAQVVTGDALRADGFANVVADAVVCNPPFNERAWGHDELQFDGRWVYGLPPRGESELAWVQHCLAHLRPGGRAVIVLPPGVASRRSGRHVRAALLRRGILRAVITLPPGAVAPAHLPMQLWVLAVDDGEATDRAWFVDTTAGLPVRLDDLGWAEVRRRATAEESDPAIRRLVPTIDLLGDDVDFTPARHLRRETDMDDPGDERDRFVALLARLPDLMPLLRPVDESTERARTTVGELVRQGTLTVLQQVGPMDVGTGPGTPVLTAPDVVAGRSPSGSVAADAAGVQLRRGDVVVPTIGSRPVAVVVEDDTDALLGPGLQLLRADPDGLDPQFLAGVLRSGETLRVAATKSGSYRIDVRRVELPRVPLGEQRRLGQTMHGLARFGAALDDAAGWGQRLVQGLTDAVLRGQLEPGGEDQ
ncbi:N-6 DNA methylase [uncultured Pseudonocardia sp.]|uniref:N-6 DNA methylase n=1 Tax=uncultured Pseudonocardia sp. TaxID=211455 RepID=UPI002619903A|nr:N-6 DNA methylase [uncultured Pseudonocardia sp.]